MVHNHINFPEMSFATIELQSIVVALPVQTY